LLRGITWTFLTQETGRSNIVSLRNAQERVKASAATRRVCPRLIWPSEKGSRHGARCGDADWQRRAVDLARRCRGTERDRLHPVVRPGGAAGADRGRGQG